MTYLRRILTSRLITGCITICVGSAIFPKQLAFTFVIGVLTVQTNLPHVCRPFINTVLENLKKFSCTVAHAPNILAFIFLTRQICKIGIDQFHGKIVIKYAIMATIVDLLPLNKCLTTKELTPVAASPSQAL
jgi:hypothetical protein